MTDDRDVVPVLKRLISRLEVLGHRGFAEVAREALAEIRLLRVDLAEALALLREVRRLAEDDAEMMDNIGSMGVLPYGGPEESSARLAAHNAFDRLARIDALLARHPAKEGP